jgi:hypothetical protein
MYPAVRRPLARLPRQVWSADLSVIVILGYLLSPHDPRVLDAMSGAAFRDAYVTNEPLNVTATCPPYATIDDGSVYVPPDERPSAPIARLRRRFHQWLHNRSFLRRQVWTALRCGANARLSGGLAASELEVLEREKPPAGMR